MWRGQRARAEGDEHVIEFEASSLRADSDGNAEAKIRAPAGNAYQCLVVAYQRRQLAGDRRVRGASVSATQVENA
jgi:hypothetical protein